MSQGVRCIISSALIGFSTGCVGTYPSSSDKVESLRSSEADAIANNNYSAVVDRILTEHAVESRTVMIFRLIDSEESNELLARFSSGPLPLDEQRLRNVFQKTQGMGFHVRQGYYLTAAHVVAGTAKLLCCGASEISGKPASFMSGVEVIRVWGDADLALVKVQSVGQDAVEVSSIQRGAEAIVSSVGRGTSVIKVPKSARRLVEDNLLGPILEFRCEGPSIAGDSGSPVFQNKRVVGVVVAGGYKRFQRERFLTQFVTLDWSRLDMVISAEIEKREPTI